MVTDELATREIVNIIVIVITQIMATLITMITQIIVIVDVRVSWIAMTANRIT